MLKAIMLRKKLSEVTKKPQGHVRRQRSLQHVRRSLRQPSTEAHTRKRRRRSIRKVEQYEKDKAENEESVLNL